MKQKDITGEKFGRLTAIKFIRREKNKYYWIFKCNCGKEKIINKYQVINGVSKSCGCDNIKDITGQKFGMLTAVKFSKKKKTGGRNRYYWEFVCDCGEKVVRRVDGVTSNNHHKNKSCGCFVNEVCRKMGLNKFKHGMSRSPFYNKWKHLIERCYNKKNKRYSSYGGRGIKVCDRWLEKFENFRDDMYESYLKHVEKDSKSQTSIERVDVDGMYSPENCIWIPMKDQCDNKTTTHYLEWNGKRMNIRQWEKYLGFKRGVISTRINNYNWSIQKALETPLLKHFL